LGQGIPKAESNHCRLRTFHIALDRLIAMKL
jgi:hypothetical protein